MLVECLVANCSKEGGGGGGSVRERECARTGGSTKWAEGVTASSSSV